MTAFLLDLLVVLLAAKIGVEIAGRIGVPGVVGEIIAGVLVGPSVLHLVRNEAPLPELAEVGVIILLLEVGLQMDLRELTKVGRSSMQVAVAGVMMPLVFGFAVARAFGESGNTALFVGAALTATSVGITARVFGDLRALATSEARTVLGAAVADDVLGLVILTVVVRIVVDGSISLPSVLQIIGVAVLFLVAAAGASSALAPPVFARVQRLAQSSGTLIGLSLVFTLGLAELASTAKLAPIVGAFVAGLALARTREAERIRRELTPVSHVFVPVFFVLIGVDSQISQFGKPQVLALAGVLTVVGVAGKVAAGWMSTASAGDRRLIGLGMIPRGEVGLIFAGVGLREGVLGENLYAALLLVVLVTTLVTPPLLHLRYRQLQRAYDTGDDAMRTPPDGGWLHIEDDAVELAARPPHDLVVPVALRAAEVVTTREAGPMLLEWLATAPDSSFVWTPGSTASLLRLLRRGNERSWRFLRTTGVLERSLPELAASIDRRRADANLLDPSSVMRWSTVQRVQEELDATDGVARPDWVVLAALILDVTAGDPDAADTARALVRRLAVGAEAEAEILLLVDETDLLAAASRRHDALDESSILPLAVHLRTRERAAALHLVTRAVSDLDTVERQRLAEIVKYVDATLEDLDDGSPNLVDVLEYRRARALALAVTPDAAVRIESAPRAWLLAFAPEMLAAQVAMLDPLPARHEARVCVNGDRVTVVCRDRVGLLAAITGAFEDLWLDVGSAMAATWRDGAALSIFTLDAGTTVDEAVLQRSIVAAFTRPTTREPCTEFVLTFDNDASPWFTIAVLDAPDARGLLHRMSGAFAAAGVQIHAAKVQTVGDRAVDTFEVTDRRGAKSPRDQQERVQFELIRGSTRHRQRRRWSPARHEELDARALGTAE